jgi:hypothetical protein
MPDMLKKMLSLRQLFESLGEAPYTLFNKNQRVALATVLFK